MELSLAGSLSNHCVILALHVTHFLTYWTTHLKSPTEDNGSRIYYFPKIEKNTHVDTHFGQSIKIKNVINNWKEQSDRHAIQNARSTGVFFIWGSLKQRKKNMVGLALPMVRHTPNIRIRLFNQLHNYT